MNQDEKVPSDEQFQKNLTQYQNTQFDDKTQAELNKPVKTAAAQMSDEDRQFLDELVKKVEAGDIDLYKPSSILNQDIYDQLTGGNKAKADLFLNATLFVIRQVYDFYHSNYSNESDMMINMLQELRLKKETLENDIGDVLKI